MNEDSILKFIAEVISSVNDSPSIALTRDDSVDTISEWDSLVTVALAAGLSSEYDVSIGVDELDKVSSVKGVFEILSFS